MLQYVMELAKIATCFIFNIDVSWFLIKVPINSCVQTLIYVVCSSNVHHVGTNCLPVFHSYQPIKPIVKETQIIKVYIHTCHKNIVIYILYYVDIVNWLVDKRYYMVTKLTFGYFSESKWTFKDIVEEFSLKTLEINWKYPAV